MGAFISIEHTENAANSGLAVKKPDWTPQNDFVDQLVMLIQVNATVAASLAMVGNETV